MATTTGVDLPLAGRLEAKVALVTGGASGLGEAIARRFVREGAYLFVTDVDEERGRAVTESLGAAARFLRHDVNSESDWLACFEIVREVHGRLDVLVNNAGISIQGSVESLSLSDFRSMLDVDLVSVFLGCKHVIPLMRGAGGSVINMSSLNGIKAKGHLAGYCSAKAAVTMLTKSAALHYAKAGYGIRCNSIHPGAIHTPMVDDLLANADDPEEMMAAWVAAHPIGRIGRPEEIAALALFLATDESGFSTGAQFVADGGWQL